MIKIKNKQAIVKMRQAGQLLCSIMDRLAPLIREGVSTAQIDAHIEKEMKLVQLKPVCKGFKSYKHATCISVNDTVVHGIPSAALILKAGDLVKVDVVGSFEGYCADMARSFFVGEASDVAQRLVSVATRALDKGIAQARVGNHLFDISAAIEREVEGAGFGVVRAFCGHGIGKDMHEEPEVPNFGEAGGGVLLRAGMVLAIEPMITEKNYDVYVTADGWTAKTVDRGLAAHVEDTVLITEEGPEILTRPSVRGENIKHEK